MIVCVGDLLLRRVAFDCFVVIVVCVLCVVCLYCLLRLVLGYLFCVIFWCVCGYVLVLVIWGWYKTGLVVCWFAFVPVSFVLVIWVFWGFALVGDLLLGS